MFDPAADLNASPHRPPGLSFAELLGDAVARAIESRGDAGGVLGPEDLREVATDAIRRALRPFGDVHYDESPRVGAWYWVRRRNQGWHRCQYVGDSAEHSWRDPQDRPVTDAIDWCARDAS